MCIEDEPLCSPIFMFQLFKPKNVVIAIDLSVFQSAT